MSKVSKLILKTPSNAVLPKRDAKGRLLKGNTANPGGAPRGKRFVTEVFQEIAAERIKITLEGKTQSLERIRVLAISLFGQATRGSPSAARVFLEYGFGLPLQRHEITGADGGALQILMPEGFNKL